MLDLTSQTEFLASPGEIPRPRSSAWKIYVRLVGYAWNYKGRLALAIIFAVVIAVSFGSMLVGLGTVAKITLYNPPAEGEAAAPDAPEDPALAMAGSIAENTRRMRSWLGWAPEGLDQWFLSLVAQMRADKMRALGFTCALVIVLAFIIGIARFLQEYFAGSIGAFISTDLAQRMYENLVQQSLGFFEMRPSGDIVARFTNDIFMVNRGLAGVFVKLMREPFKALAFFVVAVTVDPWLTLVGLCVLPPLGFSLMRLGQSVRRSVRKSLTKVASMASVVNETARGMAIVKGFNMEAYEVGRVRQEIEKLRRFLQKMVKADAATEPITEFILVTGFAGFVMFSGYRVVSEKLDLGDLLQVYLALGFMLDPVRKLSAVNNMIQTSIASAERVFEFIDMKPTVVEAPDAIELRPLREHLCFENVHFSYDGQQEVFNGLDLEIRKGEMVALVGFSGTGKSTLVKLIPRFYDVNAGAVKIDGVDVRRVTFRSLRDQISIVTQDNILFAESVRDNIAYGQAQYTEERVRDAARAAHATEFIENLPRGFETVIGESGGTLSGGQRQRLAIARAIIKDPSLLILDEATSSLDSESERYIQEALDRFVVGRTAVVIAHRLSTVQRADRIVVLDGGRVAEQGTHAELLARDGIYRRLYDIQFGVQEKTA
jgi:subfamily B ATP-binding cassette protein MsbA